MTNRSLRLAKTSRPNLSGVHSRQRLFSVLDEAREKSIIWLAGPPGSGKTTLVADYLDTWAHDYVWYQVDQGDADVATFFYYLGQAVRGSGPDRRPLPVLTPDYQRDLPAFTHRFFRELFSRLSPPFALVIDNYQEAPAQSRLHDVMRDALAEIPGEGCVILVSRSDPPASLARYRANQSLGVIGWNDIALTREESDAIVALRGENLPEKVLEQLYERTQGWAAGLVLMLEHVRNEGLMEDLPETFTPLVIFDYLAGEILQNWTPETREFLLRAATLPQMTARQAAEVSGNPAAQTILDRLTRHDYLVSSSVSDGEAVYQFHPLLRDFLTSRAEETLSREDLQALRTSAATVLEEGGQLEDTVALRIEAGDWDTLVRLIREHAATMIEQGRGETLEQWLEELPQSAIREDAWLLYWLGTCRFSMAPRESRRLYEQAVELFNAEAEPDLEGLFSACAAVMDAIHYDLDDLTSLDRWIDEVPRLIEQYPEFPSREIEARVICNLYMSMVFRQPFHPDIAEWSQRTFSIAQGQADPNTRMAVDLVLASGYVWTGRFSQAVETIKAMQGMAESREISPVALATLHNIESMYYMLVGEFGPCMEAIRKGLEIAASSGFSIWKNSTLLNGVAGALGAGDLETADDLIGQLDHQLLSRRRFDSCLLHYYTAWKAMLEEDFLQAYQDLRTTMRLAADMGLPFFEVLSGLAMAQVLFACGDDRKGSMFLRQVHEGSRNISNRLLEFMSLSIYAHLAIKYGRRASGLKSLEYAFKVAREKGFRHFLWWQPKVMAELCSYALEEDIETDYVRSLIRERGLIPEEAPLHLENWPWAFRIHTLGRFDVLQDNRSLIGDRNQGKPLAVLKTLIAFGGRDVAAERITDVLWPNIDADYAHRSLSTNLHRLRKTLGDDQAVLLQNARISLNPKLVWLDTWALVRELDAAAVTLREIGIRPDEEMLDKHVERVLGLYAGPFMPAEGDASWTLAPRDKLRNRVLRFLGDVGRHYEDREQPTLAAELYLRGLEADEAAEGLYRRLMLCYRDMGRQAEGIEIYNRCCRTLDSLLQVEPAEETRKIYESLIA